MEHLFAGIIQENTMITGGHFLIGEQGPNLNAGTIESFRQAVWVYAEAKKVVAK